MLAYKIETRDSYVKMICLGCLCSPKFSSYFDLKFKISPIVGIVFLKFKKLNVTHTKDFCGKKGHQIRLQEFIYFPSKINIFRTIAFPIKSPEYWAGFLYFFLLSSLTCKPNLANSSVWMWMTTTTTSQGKKKHILAKKK
jgi:hypothetical protein